MANSVVDIDDFEGEYQEDTIDSLMSRVTPEQQQETDAKMLLASKIYKAMKQKGWTQTQFAANARQKDSVISKWLSGTHNFTVDTILLIQRVLGILLLDLAERKDKMMIDVKVTVTSSVPLSEQELQRVIQDNGGMAATIAKAYKVQG